MQELIDALMPVFDVVYNTNPESDPFVQPVNPEFLGIPVRYIFFRQILCPLLLIVLLWKALFLKEWYSILQNIVILFVFYFQLFVNFSIYGPRYIRMVSAAEIKWQDLKPSLRQFVFIKLNWYSIYVWCTLFACQTKVYTFRHKNFGAKLDWSSKSSVLLVSKYLLKVRWKVQFNIIKQHFHWLRQMEESNVLQELSVAKNEPLLHHADPI